MRHKLLLDYITRTTLASYCGTSCRSTGQRLITSRGAALASWECRRWAFTMLPARQALASLARKRKEQQAHIIARATSRMAALSANFSSG